jgi:hypothetical protein
MKTRIFCALFLLAFSQPLFPQDLVPATSEDIQEFDRQVAKQHKPDAAAKTKAATFGSQVSEEARKQKDVPKDQRGDFGQWVSDQRKKSDQGQAAAAGSVGDSDSHGNSGSHGQAPDHPTPGDHGKRPTK